MVTSTKTRGDMTMRSTCMGTTKKRTVMITITLIEVVLARVVMDC